MITDFQTNKVYLSKKLGEKFSDFNSDFISALKSVGIYCGVLENTKDIWAVDYMPLQIGDNDFVQFNYNPDYLEEYPELRTKVDSKFLESNNLSNLKVKKSKLKVDGGNIIRGEKKVIMCDKVFHENKKKEKEIIEELEELFHPCKIIFVPWDINDFTGHADGMVRFINDDTVLINKYFGENPKFETSFRMSLRNAGLNWVELPYNPPYDSTLVSARGLYLNYLQMSNGIFLPTYSNKKLDDEAEKILQSAFPKQNIYRVESSDLAREGGVLNCITWNILQ